MHNTLKILGCSGSISKGHRTTCFKINENILIDAGSGVLDLTIDELKKLDHIFITHSHLDHILGIPLLADAIGSLKRKPINIYAAAETINALKNNIFNNIIWPDFSTIPSKTKPFIKYHLINDKDITIKSIRIKPFKVNHTVPAIGFKISSKTSSIIFSGDTGPSPNFIKIINDAKDLKAVIIDVSFQDKNSKIAKLSKHFTPTQLSNELKKITDKQVIYITHNKPGNEQKILREIQSKKMQHTIKVLRKNKLFTL